MRLSEAQTEPRCWVQVGTPSQVLGPGLRRSAGVRGGRRERGSRNRRSPDGSPRGDSCGGRGSRAGPASGRRPGRDRPPRAAAGGCPGRSQHRSSRGRVAPPGAGSARSSTGCETFKSLQTRKHCQAIHPRKLLQRSPELVLSRIPFFSVHAVDTLVRDLYLRCVSTRQR